jgi:hypothetical protein
MCRMIVDCLVARQRKDAVPSQGLGGIPVEYKGATIPPPDTRRSYS